MVGIMMVVSGVAEVISAFQVRPWSRALLWVLIGGLYIAAGILAFENPHAYGKVPDPPARPVARCVRYCGESSLRRP